MRTCKSSRTLPVRAFPRDDQALTVDVATGRAPLTVRVSGPQEVVNAMPAGGLAAHFVLIDWGDGWRSPMHMGPPFPNPPEPFGTHVYTVPGQYVVKVTSYRGGHSPSPMWKGSASVDVQGTSPLTPSLRIIRTSAGPEFEYGGFPYLEWRLTTDRKVDLHAQFINHKGKCFAEDILEGIAHSYPMQGKTFTPKPVSLYDKALGAGIRRFKIRLVLKDENGNEICPCETDYFFMRPKGAKRSSGKDRFHQ